jgi:hypothetical protein
MCQVAPEPRLRHWLRQDRCGIGCGSLVYGARGVDLKCQSHRSTWWWWRNNGTVEFELHVNWPRNHVCDTGCPWISVECLDVESLVLWYQRVDLSNPAMVVVAEQLER